MLFWEMQCHVTRVEVCYVTENNRQNTRWPMTRKRIYYLWASGSIFPSQPHTHDRFLYSWKYRKNDGGMWFCIWQPLFWTDPEVINFFRAQLSWEWNWLNLQCFLIFVKQHSGKCSTIRELNQASNVRTAHNA